ncbi:hypothetical protein XaavBphi31_24 [Xanthomonas phage Xaa_vB_phi31]|uniref:Uncharacterized protein n=1 Tax=Xanthomonas phage Xaa_vB_phi31 TaxID=2776752 RepID=A0A868BZ11_9CAUD|nr:hypothetical protein XaavBphi31_24 [Xanthomonas phage Xaa_vB_phi31]
MNYENLTQARHLADNVARWLAGHMASIRARQYISDNTATVTYRALHDWSESLRRIQSLVTIKRTPKTTVKLLFSRRSLWVGLHYSEVNRRLCINLLPGVTICITKAGGVEP